MSILAFETDERVRSVEITDDLLSVALMDGYAIFTPRFARAR